ncbi:hypothetical protein [Amycolatopsis samaneae]|uniref:Uncharacterized protein n=1 Tax=Amycolatopsis samaneae TaxID=664691 RepID=A0ABW5GHD8_9PSEU
MGETGGWIREENLAKVMAYLAGLVDYDWDDFDADALDAGIPPTDADLPTDTWFEYPVVGMPALSLRIAREQGAGLLSMYITGDFDSVLAARFETLLDLH